MKFKDVKKFNLELNNICNLSCTLCQRNNSEMIPYLKNKNHLDFNILKKALNLFENLDEILILGNLSEPILYYKFLDLIKFLKHKNIKITVSTNGNPYNKIFWEEFGKILNFNDKIIFAIDGSTQDKYTQYRINGKLEKVIYNYKTFAENTNARKIIQIIKFPWLEKDLNIEFENLKKLINPENKLVYQFERKKLNNHTTMEIQTEEDKKLNLFYSKIISKNLKLQKPKIDCFSKSSKNLYINYLGDIIPCCYTHEELLLDRENKKIPNIYNDDFSKEFEKFFNNWYEKEIFQTESCLEICSSKLKFFRRG